VPDIRYTKLFFGDTGEGVDSSGNSHASFHCVSPKDLSAIGVFTVNNLSGSFIPEGFYSSPLMGPELSTGTNVYITSRDGEIYCFNVNDLSGGPNWHKTVDSNPGSASNSGHLDSSPVMGPDGNIYVGSADGNLYKVITTDGTTQPTSIANTGGFRIESSPAIGTNGWVYFADFNGKMWAVNPANAQVKWWAQPSPYVDVKTSPVISSSGIVFFASNDHHVYGFNAYTDAAGAQVSPLYTSPDLGGIVCGGMTLDGRGTLYVAPYKTGPLFALQVANGQLGVAWRFTSYLNTTFSGMYAAPAIGPDGSLYIGDIGGNIFKFEAGAFPNPAPLQASVWPTFQRDMSRSGDGKYNRWESAGTTSINPVGPFSTGTHSYTYAVNKGGDTVGIADGVYTGGYNYGYCPALWFSGVTTPVNYFTWQKSTGSATTYAYGINDKQDFAGTAPLKENVSPFNYFNTAFAVLGLNQHPIYLMPNDGTSTSIAYGISIDRTVVGNVNSTAVFWSFSTSSQSFSSAQSLGSLYAPGGPGLPTYVDGIGNIDLQPLILSKRVVGKGQTTSGGIYHAFQTDLSTLLNGTGAGDLETLSGQFTDASVAYNLADSGYVVGSSTASGGQTHAFRFDNSGAVLAPWQDLGTLGGVFSEAYGVNNLGQTVGTSTTSGGVNHAFIWTPSLGMVDLNSKIPPGTGWVLQTAESINDAGTIVGNGTLNGATRGYVITISH
jgi:probable HAF family extracellular repeat protein